MIDRVEVSQSDLVAILYSSRTTGRVKGVMLTHRNLMATVSGTYAHCQTKRENEKARESPTSETERYGKRRRP